MHPAVLQFFQKLAESIAGSGSGSGSWLGGGAFVEGVEERGDLEMGSGGAGEAELGRGGGSVTHGLEA